eukprot:jgi/Mesvir1/15793/Mv03358-RA.2
MGVQPRAPPLARDSTFSRPNCSMNPSAGSTDGPDIDATRAEHLFHEIAARRPGRDIHDALGSILGSVFGLLSTDAAVSFLPLRSALKHASLADIPQLPELLRALGFRLNPLVSVDNDAPEVINSNDTAHHDDGAAHGIDKHDSGRSAHADVMVTQSRGNGVHRDLMLVMHAADARTHLPAIRAVHKLCLQLHASAVGHHPALKTASMPPAFGSIAPPPVAHGNTMFTVDKGVGKDMDKGVGVGEDKGKGVGVGKSNSVMDGTLCAMNSHDQTARMQVETPTSLACPANQPRKRPVVGSASVSGGREESQPPGKRAREGEGAAPASGGPCPGSQATSASMPAEGRSLPHMEGSCMDPTPAQELSHMDPTPAQELSHMDPTDDAVTLRGTHSSSLVNADLSVRDEGHAYASTVAVTAANGNRGGDVAAPTDDAECSGDARSAHSRDGATDMPGNHEDPATFMVVRNEDLPYVPAAGATDVDMHVCGDHAANEAMVTAAEGQPRLAGDKVTVGSTMSIPPGSTSSLAAVTERLRTSSAQREAPRKRAAEGPALMPRAARVLDQQAHPRGGAHAQGSESGVGRSLPLSAEPRCLLAEPSPLLADAMPASLDDASPLVAERPSLSADPSPRSAGMPSAPAGTEQQKLEQQEQKKLEQKKLEQQERKSEEQELETIAPAPPAPPHVALPAVPEDAASRGHDGPSSLHGVASGDCTTHALAPSDASHSQGPFAIPRSQGNIPRLPSEQGQVPRVYASELPMIQSAVIFPTVPTGLARDDAATMELGPRRGMPLSPEQGIQAPVETPATGETPRTGDMGKRAIQPEAEAEAEAPSLQEPQTEGGSRAGQGEGEAEAGSEVEGGEEAESGAVMDVMEEWEGHGQAESAQGGGESVGEELDGEAEAMGYGETVGERGEEGGGEKDGFLRGGGEGQGREEGQRLALGPDPLLNATASIIASPVTETSIMPLPGRENSIVTLPGRESSAPPCVEEQHIKRWPQWAVAVFADYLFQQQVVERFELFFLRTAGTRFAVQYLIETLGRQEVKQHAQAFVRDPDQWRALWVKFDEEGEGSATPASRQVPEAKPRPARQRETRASQPLQLQPQTLLPRPLQRQALQPWWSQPQARQSQLWQSAPSQPQPSQLPVSQAHPLQTPSWQPQASQPQPSQPRAEARAEARVMASMQPRAVASAQPDLTLRNVTPTLACEGLHSRSLGLQATGNYTGGWAGAGLQQGLPQPQATAQYPAPRPLWPQPPLPAWARTSCQPGAYTGVLPLADTGMQGGAHAWAQQQARPGVPSRAVQEGQPRPDAGVPAGPHAVVETWVGYGVRARAESGQVPYPAQAHPTGAQARGYPEAQPRSHERLQAWVREEVPAPRESCSPAHAQAPSQQHSHLQLQSHSQVQLQPQPAQALMQLYARLHAGDSAPMPERTQPQLAQARSSTPAFSQAELRSQARVSLQAEREAGASSQVTSRASVQAGHGAGVPTQVTPQAPVQAQASVRMQAQTQPQAMAQVQPQLAWANLQPQAPAQAGNERLMLGQLTSRAQAREGPLLTAQAQSQVQAHAQSQARAQSQAQQHALNVQQHLVRIGQHSSTLQPTIRLGGQPSTSLLPGQQPTQLSIGQQSSLLQARLPVASTAGSGLPVANTAGRELPVANTAGSKPPAVPAPQSVQVPTSARPECPRSNPCGAALSTGIPAPQRCTDSSTHHGVDSSTHQCTSSSTHPGVCSSTPLTEVPCSHPANIVLTSAANVLVPTSVPDNQPLRTSMPDALLPANVTKQPMAASFTNAPAPASSTEAPVLASFTNQPARTSFTNQAVPASFTDHAVPASIINQAAPVSIINEPAVPAPMSQEPRPPAASPRNLLPSPLSTESLPSSSSRERTLLPARTDTVLHGQPGVGDVLASLRTRTLAEWPNAARVVFYQYVLGRVSKSKSKRLSWSRIGFHQTQNLKTGDFGFAYLLLSELGASTMGIHMAAFLREPTAQVRRGSCGVMIAVFVVELE